MPQPLEVDHRDHDGDHGIDDAFRRLPALMQDQIGRHQMTHVANQHQAAAGNLHLAARRRPVTAIGIELAIDMAAALGEPRREIAAHQSEPVAIHRHLVGAVDRRDGVLEIHDRGQRRFELHVRNAGRVVAADRMRAIDAHLDVQPMVLEQQRGRGSLRAEVPFELRRPGQGGLRRHRSARP